MADYGYGGAEEENAELKRLNADVLEDPDSFENWEKLVRAAESIDGGLTRNSSPQSIAAARDVYDRFLAKFPLFFGYWKKYADLEFSIAGTEAAELVYERGVASTTNSVDLWAQYCAFKVETSHDPDVIRELFERAASSVGLDFLAHPFWDKYLEFEERLEAYDRIFSILGRIIHIPMHQYARYFERFRQLASSRPVNELAPSEVVAQFRAEVGMEAAQNPKTDADLERDLRTRIDGYHFEIFQRCQDETTKRWKYEQEVKRPYFHVTELDEGQLTNWHSYLDFEEAEGEYTRIVFLYERCLVAAAYYDEFWLRYARWMSAQMGKTEEIRNIYERASCLYTPIARPEVRLQYALFEESTGRVDVAQAIYEAMLTTMPGHVETITAWANSARRNSGIDAAVAVYKEYIASDTCDTATKASLVAELARLLWRTKGDVEEARQTFHDSEQIFLDSRTYWTRYLMFEIEQPMTADAADSQHARIKQVYDDIRRKSQLPMEAVKELSHMYMVYLLERATVGAAKEYLVLDREINGPQSAQTQGGIGSSGANQAKSAAGEAAQNGGAIRGYS